MPSHAMEKSIVLSDWVVQKWFLVTLSRRDVTREKNNKKIFMFVDTDLTSGQENILATKINEV